MSRVLEQVSTGLRWNLARTCSFLVLVAAAAGTWGSATEGAEPLKAGMIGLDTSHVIAYTKMLNDPNATGELAEMVIVAGYPGGSPDFPLSRDRVEGFTKQVREMGVEIVDTIEELLLKVDVVLLTSGDGRPHLEQVRPVFAAGKPVYIDKPLAGSLSDAVEIFRLATEYDVPCFSSSSLRFSPGIIKFRGGNEEIGEVRGCNAYSPCPIGPHHPDLFWYGVHGVETLFTIMGPGCKSVTRVRTQGTELAVGVWEDGRVGTFRGIRDGKADFGATVYGTKAILPSGKYEGYKPLVIEMVRFFRSGRPPVSAEETLEIFAFMEAAEESKLRGGGPVSLESVMAKARRRASAERR